MEQCPTTHLAQARAYVCASFDVEHRETMAIDSAGRRRRVSMECWCGEKENCLCANANNEQRTDYLINFTNIFIYVMFTCAIYPQAPLSTVHPSR